MTETMRKSTSTKNLNVPFLGQLALLFLVLSPLASLQPAAAQEPEAPIFVERVEVNVINVEVFVTDKDGNPVVGLTREDFEITQEGEPVEITNFFTIAREDRMLRDPLVSEPTSQESGPAPERALPEDQQLNLMVYVDNYNIHPTSRKLVLEDLEGFLGDRVRQGDNVMLASYFRTVEIVEPFTRDLDRLKEGLRKMSQAATYRPTQDALRRQRMQLMRDSAGEGDVDSAYNFLRGYVQAARADLRRTTGSLEQVVRALAGVPGRKALLYVSDGLSQRPGEELYLQMQNLFDQQALKRQGGGQLIDPLIETLGEDENQLFDAITRQANAHQVTLYMVDARGTRGASTLSAQYNDLSAGSGGRSTIDALRTQNLQEPLIRLADGTGGATVLNSNDFEASFHDMASDFDSFYSLGYSAPTGGDGEFHRIDVKVKTPGLNVRHRAGFVDKSRQERVADRTLSSLILNLEKNPLGISVDFGQPVKEGRGKFLLPVLIRVPFREVTFLNNGENVEARLRIFVGVGDEEANVSDLQEIPYPLSIPEAQLAEARTRDFGYAAKLKIRPGVPKIVVGVWDELSDVESFVLKKVRVEKE